MGRVTGVIALLVGVALTYSLVFSQFDREVSRFTINEEGERVPMTHVACPSPWSVVVNGVEPDVVAGQEVCKQPSVTLIIEGVLVALGSLAVGIWGLTRKRPAPLPELPPSLQHSWRERVWRNGR